MSAEFLPSARPIWAVCAWVDENNVFVEIPVLNQAPFIAKYRNDPTGLGQALRDMREYHRVKEAPLIYTTPPRIASSPSPYTEPTRAKAQAILRKLGITGR